MSWQLKRESFSVCEIAMSEYALGCLCVYMCVCAYFPSSSALNQRMQRGWEEACFREREEGVNLIQLDVALSMKMEEFKEGHSGLCPAGLRSIGRLHDLVVGEGVLGVSALRVLIL